MLTEEGMTYTRTLTFQLERLLAGNHTLSGSPDHVLKECPSRFTPACAFE
jgi:hypothetical protein